MKKMILVVAAALAIQTSALYAAENTQSAKHAQNKTMQMGVSNGDMDKMKQNMKKMMKQMDEIHSTNDPKRREKLMHEHMQNMHKGMNMMRNMGGDMMMGMNGGKDMMSKGMGNNMSNQEGGKRHQMMEQRMDMMQMMMEQMMGRMSMREGMMPKMK